MIIPLILLFGMSMAFPQQPTVTVTYTEYPKAFANPLKGLLNHKDYVTIDHVYINWKDIENNESDGIEKIKAYWENLVRNFPASNLKIIPRIQLENHKGKYWPADIPTGDYTSVKFIARLKRLIQRLGEVWDNDPRVAFVDMGMIGLWGEHHHPILTPEMQQLLGEEFTKAFKNKKVSHRYTRDFKNFSFGIYWDSFAHPDDEKDALGWLGMGNRWQTQVFGGEVATNWGKVGSVLGTSQLQTFTNPKYFNRFHNYVRSLHVTQLRAMSGYSGGNAVADKYAEIIQKAFGYQFVLKEATFPTQITKGSPFQVSFKVVNTGSAPFYYVWPVELSLLDTKSKQVVWKQIFQTVNITSWLPGDQWQYQKTDPSIEGTGYAIPPNFMVESEQFQLPNTIPNGEYLLALATLDPGGGQPAVKFAVTNYLTGGRHPLGKVGVGLSVGNHLLNAAEFVDLQADKLKYGMEIIPFAKPISIKSKIIRKNSTKSHFLGSKNLTEDQLKMNRGFGINGKTVQIGKTKNPAHSNAVIVVKPFGE